MQMPPGEPRLSREQCAVLALLANIPHGIREEVLVLAHGFNRSMIAGLIHEGLAMARREVVTDPNRTIVEAVRIMITDAGRKALCG